MEEARERRDEDICLCSLITHTFIYSFIAQQCIHLFYCHYIDSQGLQMNESPEITSTLQPYNAKGHNTTGEN